MPARRMPVPSQSSVTSQAPTRVTVAATGADTGVPAATNASAPRCTEAGGSDCSGRACTRRPSPQRPMPPPSSARTRRLVAGSAHSPNRSTSPRTDRSSTPAGTCGTSGTATAPISASRSAAARACRDGPRPSAGAQRLVHQFRRDRLQPVGHDPTAAHELLRVRVVGLEDRLLLLADRAHRAAGEHQRPDRLDLGLATAAGCRGSRGSPRPRSRALASGRRAPATARRWRCPRCATCASGRRSRSGRSAPCGPSGRGSP